MLSTKAFTAILISQFLCTAYLLVYIYWIRKHTQNISKYLQRQRDNPTKKPHDLSRFNNYFFSPFLKLTRQIEKLSKDFYNSQKLEKRHLRDRAQLLENIDTGILAVHQDGRVLYFNKKLFEYGLSLQEPSIEDNSPELPLNQILQNTELITLVKKNLELLNSHDELLSLKEGKEYQVSDAPFNNSKGDLVGKVFFIEALDSKEDFSKLKKQFLSNLSHQLKTPLTNILGYLELLQDSQDLDEVEKKRFIKVAYEQTNELKELTEQMLLLTKIDSFNAENIKKTNCCMKTIVFDAISLHQVFADEKNLSINYSHELSEGLLVFGNRHLLREAIGNVLSNAIKYSAPQTEVQISCRSTQELNIEISIRDFGHGISREEKKKIFERFYRAPKAYLSQYEKGFGLGLPIAHKIISMHNGKVELDSELGRGTVFSILLPQALPEKRKTPES